jgi:uncharacterized protein (DUF58 family)
VQHSLPCPGIHFEEDYLRRVDSLHARLVAVRERREGGGRASILGPGEDFVGYRPYSPGEDLRCLDWNLLARLDRPYVQVRRREAEEVWAVLIDASGSMGVGPPGKLQRAAECAGALACLGRRFGAEVRLVVSGGEEESPATFVLRSRDDPRSALRFLESFSAEGRGGLSRLVAAPFVFAEAGRIFAIGDLLDLEPPALLRLNRAGRGIAALQWLAPIELHPGIGAVEWLDPEGPERCRMQVDGAALARYEALLDLRLERWRELTSRHGIAFGCRSTETPFETAVRDLLRA